jgi:hypothetical protein
VDTETGTEVKESFVKAAAEQVQVAVADVKLEKAIIKTTSDTKRQELKEIQAEPDGKERRKRLARLVRKSL